MSAMFNKKRKETVRKFEVKIINVGSVTELRQKKTTFFYLFEEFFNHHN